MERGRSHGRTSSPGVMMTSALALLFFVCLVECASEQRINSRGSKPSNLFEKVNGWRTQRGGSCLSYGHSCWGAHGKRSGKPPGAASDWFLNKLYRRADLADSDMRHRQVSKNDEINAIFQAEGVIESPSADRLGSNNENVPLQVAANRNPQAKPMLDEDLLSKIKLWQIMREAVEE